MSRKRYMKHGSNLLLNRDCLSFTRSSYATRNIFKILVRTETDEKNQKL